MIGPQLQQANHGKALFEKMGTDRIQLSGIYLGLGQILKYHQKWIENTHHDQTSAVPRGFPSHPLRPRLSFS